MYLRIADFRCRLLGLFPRESQLNLNVGGDGDGATGFKINFCLPPPRQEVSPPPPVDVTPQGPPDYSRPALPPPPARARTPFGALWEAPDDKGWMK
jgi:hypothetical protein